VEIDKLTPPSRPGVRGSMVIQEKITELLDMVALLSMMREKTRTAVLVGAGAEKSDGF
jgi:hypothetical protein